MLGNSNFQRLYRRSGLQTWVSVFNVSITHARWLLALRLRRNRSYGAVQKCVSDLSHFTLFIPRLGSKGKAGRSLRNALSYSSCAAWCKPECLGWSAWRWSETPRKTCADPCKMVPARGIEPRTY
jgi:hypothetical protein